MDKNKFDAHTFIPFKDMTTSAQYSFTHLHPKLLHGTDKLEIKEDYIPKITIEEAKEKLEWSYNAIIYILERYVDMSIEQRKFLATWIIGTYFHEQFNTYPHLFFNAMRGSGKTRVLKLISALGYKGDGSVQNNITEAVLFRIPRGTTTCIDEVEQIGNKEKQTLRELLNAAYKKGMKICRMRKVKRNNEEKQEAEIFEPYMPITMANINGIDEVLADRSITLILEKSSNDNITMKVEDFDTNPLILQVKRTLESINDVCDVTLRGKNYNEEWNVYLDERHNITTSSSYNIYITSITSPLEKMKLNELFNKIYEKKIVGRNFELLFPLFLVADLIGESVFTDILKIGGDLTNQKKEEEYADSKDVALYQFISSIAHHGLIHLSVKQLVIDFRQFIGESEDQDRWLNEKWLGRALKRLNLLVHKKHTQQGSSVILDYPKAKEKLKMFKSGES